MADSDSFTLAAIQAAPVFLDREASTEKACRLIEEAAATGASLAAFGEAWLPGYPFHAASLAAGAIWWEVAADYIAQAVEVPGPTTDRLCAAAGKAGIDVVIGIVELDPRTRGTVYATQLFIGCEGKILGRHRKLMPTLAERIAWGAGDASGLTVYQRPYGRISGLNCWEHQMLLPGYALMAQGTQIHVAAWPGRECAAPDAPVALWPRQHLLSRAFASQGACFVICVGGILRPADIPQKYRELAKVEYTGDSVIIDPRGEIIAGPVGGEETIVTATVSLGLVRAAKAVLDVAGHYSRSDVLQILVDGHPLARTRGLQSAEDAGLAEANKDDATPDITAGC